MQRESCAGWRGWGLLLTTSPTETLKIERWPVWGWNKNERWSFFPGQEDESSPPIKLHFSYVFGHFRPQWPAIRPTIFCISGWISTLYQRDQMMLHWDKKHRGSQSYFNNLVIEIIPWGEGRNHLMGDRLPFWQISCWSSSLKASGWWLSPEAPRSSSI